MDNTTEKKPSNNTPYIIAITVMLFIGMASIVILTILKPEIDNTALIAAVFAFLAPTTLSLLALMKAQETHLAVNSRLDQFIENAGAISRAEGVTEGQKIANERTDDLANKFL